MENRRNSAAWLHRSVVEFLVAEAETWAPRETGGVLLGYFGQPGNVPVILQAIGAGPRAVHRRWYYSPDVEFDESQVALYYEKSGRKTIYLGDWHTHPSPVSHLSKRDKRTLRRIARCRSARVEFPIMLVLSLGEVWQPTLWQGSLHARSFWSRGLKVTELTAHLFPGDT